MNAGPLEVQTNTLSAIYKIYPLNYTQEDPQEQQVWVRAMESEAKRVGSKQIVWDQGFLRYNHRSVTRALTSGPSFISLQPQKQ